MDISTRVQHRTSVFVQSEWFFLAIALISSWTCKVGATRFGRGLNGFSDGGGAVAADVDRLWHVAVAGSGRGDGDWQSFGRDPGARRFSPLTRINTKNVASLVEAWTFDTGIQDLQVTPIVIDGLMYFTGGPTVFALEPETGKTVCTFRAQGARQPTWRALLARGGSTAPGCSPALCSGRRRCQEKIDPDY